MTASVKAKKPDESNPGWLFVFFGFCVGIVFGTIIMKVSNDLRGGLLSEALEKYTVCLRLQAPELNCRRTYFYMGDQQP